MERNFRIDLLNGTFRKNSLDKRKKARKYQYFLEVVVIVNTRSETKAYT